MMSGTKLLTIISLLLLAFNAAASNTTTPDSLKLKFVMEFSRHGARAPMFDTYDAKDWPLEKEVLTAVGMRQFFLLGRELNERYIVKENLLNATLIPSQIYVRSTDVDRTIMSAQSQLYGLYYRSGPNFPNDRARWNAVPPLKLSPEVMHYVEYLWNKALPNQMQPIPVHVVPEDDDTLFFNQYKCPRIQQIRATEPNTPEFIEIQQKLRDEGFYDSFSKLVDVPVSSLSLDYFQSYWDTLECDIYEGRDVPDWTWGTTGKKLRFVHAFLNLHKWAITEEQKNLIVSNLFSEMKNSMAKVVNGSDPNTKFKFFSGHDDTINRILVGLNVSHWTNDFNEYLHPKSGYIRKNPGFASTLFFELFQDTVSSKYYVHLLFNDQPIQLTGACNKAEFCLLENFNKLLDERIVPNIEEACKEKK